MGTECLLLALCLWYIKFRTRYVSKIPEGNPFPNLGTPYTDTH